MIVIIRDHHFYLGGDTIKNQSKANNQPTKRPADQTNKQTNKQTNDWCNDEVSEQKGCFQINYKISTKSSNLAFV